MGVASDAGEVIDLHCNSQDGSRIILYCCEGEELELCALDSCNVVISRADEARLLALLVERAGGLEALADQAGQTVFTAWCFTCEAWKEPGGCACPAPDPDAPLKTPDVKRVSGAEVAKALGAEPVDPVQVGVSYTLGGQTWVMSETPWDSRNPAYHGHNLLFRNQRAPGLARWVHPDELHALLRLGVVKLPRPLAPDRRT